MIEAAALIAEIIARYAIFEDVYLQSTSPATDELKRSLVHLYTATMIYLSKAKSYFNQNSASQYSYFGFKFSADENGQSVSLKADSLQIQTSTRTLALLPLHKKLLIVA